MHSRSVKTKNNLISARTDGLKEESHFLSHIPFSMVWAPLRITYNAVHGGRERKERKSSFHFYANPCSKSSSSSLPKLTA